MSSELPHIKTPPRGNFQRGGGPYDGKIFQSHFQRAGATQGYSKRHAGLNFQPNGRPYGRKCQLIASAKSNKKLQKNDKTVTKCYKTVTNCEIFNNCAK